MRAGAYEIDGWRALGAVLIGASAALTGGLILWAAPAIAAWCRAL